jgi:hypothetical protein
VDGRVVGDVGLARGLRVELAPEVSLEVTAVGLPLAVLSLCWPGHRVPLLHDAAAVVLDPEPQVRWTDDPGAAARLWRVGEGWRLRVGDGPPRDLAEGATFEVGGVTFETRSTPLSDAGARPTVGPLDPVRVVLFYDTVHLQARGRPVLVVNGRAARLLSELATARVPMAWQVAAGELWSDRAADEVLRKRLDAVLHRLRQKLAGAGFRDDLVGPDGRGLLELRLGPDDVVVDRT